MVYLRAALRNLHLPRFPGRPSPARIALVGDGRVGSTVTLERFLGSIYLHVRFQQGCEASRPFPAQP